MYSLPPPPPPLPRHESSAKPTPSTKGSKDLLPSRRLSTVLGPVVVAVVVAAARPVTASRALHGVWGVRIEMRGQMVLLLFGIRTPSPTAAEEVVKGPPLQVVQGVLLHIVSLLLKSGFMRLT